MKMQKVYSTQMRCKHLFACLLVLVMMACSSHTAIKHKGAYIEVQNREVSVGAIKKDATKHNYEVSITNTGDAPLVISEILSSCYCATAEMPQEAIEPGDSYRMKIVLDVSEMALQDPFVREFYIKSNATNEKDLTISLTGSIVK